MGTVLATEADATIVGAVEILMGASEVLKDDTVVGVRGVELLFMGLLSAWTAKKTKINKHIKIIV